MMSINKKILIGFYSIIIFGLTSCALIPSFQSSEPIEAWIVDTETNKPLEGVIVVVHWEIVAGGWASGSSPVANYEVMETTTDSDGHFNFPAWGPGITFQGYNSRTGARFVIFKPGYEYENFSNPGSLWDSRHPGISQWHGKTIKLKKFTGSMEKYAEEIYGLSRVMGRTLEYGRGSEDCHWKHTPLMLSTLHKLSIDIAKKGIKIKGWRGGARILTINEIPFRKACGTAKEFFEEYLQ